MVDFNDLIERASTLYKEDNYVIDFATEDYLKQGRGRKSKNQKAADNQSTLAEQRYLAASTGDEELLAEIYKKAKQSNTGEPLNIEQFRSNFRQLLEEKSLILNPPASSEERIKVLTDLAIKAYEAAPVESEDYKKDYTRAASKYFALKIKELKEEEKKMEATGAETNKKLAEVLQESGGKGEWLEEAGALIDKLRDCKQVLEIFREHQQYLTSFYFDEKGTNIDKKNADADYVYKKADENSTSSKEFKQNILAELDNLFNQSTKKLIQRNKINSQAEINEVYEQIDKIRQLGMSLYKDDLAAGKKLTELAGKLSAEIDSFLKKSPQEISEMTEKFDDKFKALLHSEDKAMSKHLNKWEPIAANVMLALSVIGLIAMAIKAVYVSIKDKKISAHSGLFFFDEKDKDNRLRYKGFRQLTDSLGKGAQGISSIDSQNDSEEEITPRNPGGSGS